MGSGFEAKPGAAVAILARSGDVGRDLLAVDWSETAVGPPSEWPPSLTSAVATVLGSRFSMWMAWGPELTFFCNDAYRRDTLGTKYPWALGRPASEVWSEIWDEIGPRIDSVMLTGEATWDEGLLLFLERSGYKEETYHTFSYSPLADEAGVVRGMLCVVSEDTDRVVSERQLATLRVLATETASAQTEQEFLDASARSLATNQRSLPFALIYRFTDDGGAELAACSGIVPGDPAAPRRIEPQDSSKWPLDRVREGNAATLEDLRERFSSMPTGAWEDPPIRARLVPLRIRTEDRPFGFLVAATNPYHLLHEGLIRLTQLIARHIANGVASTRAYEDERERARQLAELDAAKTEFFTNVSHELRTPLTLMLGPAEDALLDQDEPLGPNQRRRLEVIERNAQRLLKLVNELLDFSRAASKEDVGLFVPTDLPALTTEIASMLESGATRAGLGFSVECDPITEPVWVDREMWTKIVSNLLSNALKFTLEGEVAVELRQRDEAVELIVRDTGSGIDASEHERLFERFHRVGGAQARSHEGSGVGLALVAELTARHGGAVAVESALGMGSAFSVTIPLGNDHLPAERLGDAGPGIEAAAQSAGEYVDEVVHWIDDLRPDEQPPKTAGAFDVLVVDDNSDMREYVRGLLNGRYSVTTAADGEAALEQVDRAIPDLVITDVMMPKVDGFELLKRLRENPATMHIPVIMLSARAGEEGIVSGLEAGADDYLVKPFTARELLARVASTLELDRTRRAGEELARRQILLDEAQRLAQIGSWEIDWATGGVTATDETLRIVGVSRDELAQLGLAGSIESVVHPEDRERVERALAAGAAGDPIEFEARLIVKRRTLQVRVVGEMVSDNGGGIRLRGSIQDVTSQRQIERDLADALATREAAAREREIADQLQRSLLPAQTFDSGDLEVATFYRPGVEGTQVGGDWFDVIDLGGGRTALVIGDVMGRGVTAASAMGQLRTAVRAYARLDLNPAEVVKQLALVVEDFTEDQLVTLIYGVHNAEAGSFTFANAGHLPPIVATPEACRPLSPATGPPLAVGIDVDREETEIELPPDSVLLLYTDGLVERRDADLAERIDALVEAVEGSETDFKDLPYVLVERLDSASADDDIAVLAAHIPRTPGGGSRFAETLITFSLPGIRTTRHFVQNALAAWRVAPASIADAALLVSELVTNAVVHAAAPGRLVMRLRAGVLTVEVIDSSSGEPRVVDDVGPEDLGGRGLLIVETVSSAWGSKSAGAGKAVWFTMNVEMDSRGDGPAVVVADQA